MSPARRRYSRACSALRGCEGVGDRVLSTESRVLPSQATEDLDAAEDRDSRLVLLSNDAPRDAQSGTAGGLSMHRSSRLR